MSLTQVTLDEIITTVRELTFDRFIIPAFSVKARAGWEISIQTPKGEDMGNVTLNKIVVEEGEEEKIVVEFSTFDTLEKLMDELIEQDIVVAYTPYFKGGEPSNSLIKVSNISLDANFTAYRRYFFSDAEVKKTIHEYYRRVLELPVKQITDDVIAKLQRPSEEHIALWVSYGLVDKRRMYESASEAIGQSFTDGSDYIGSFSGSTPLSTSISIGSVFSISESATAGFFQEDFNRIGSENVWGDRYSFWYKLMLYLRQRLEEVFNDYSLRKDNVMMGNIELTRDLDFRSYYDSYPFTLSPLSRGILSKTP